MSLIDSPLKGCQSHTNRVRPLCMRWSYFACGVNDTAFTTCMQCQSSRRQSRFAYDFHFSKLFENFILHAMLMNPYAK
jgi:hypothetical protein